MNNKWLGLFLVLTCALPMAAQRPAAERITNGPVVEGTGDTWAVVAWTTNTGGSSVVRYGTSPRNLNESAQAPYADNDRTSAQNHRVRLQNLMPDTTYFYVVDSGQGEGTGTEARSSVGKFTTGGRGSRRGGNPPRDEAVRIIDGPRVEGTGHNWAVIAWTTNAASSSVVHYGNERNDLRETGQSPYVDNDNVANQTHRVRLTNLRPNSTYFFLVDSGQGEGTGTGAKSQISQFRTK
jgi:phosphodiesterase/alkaline phosphatase D-like protein